MNYGRRYKADANEAEIVAALRAIPGIAVETGHDDLLIGHQGATYWFEVKAPSAMNKSGKVSRTANKTAQKQMRLAQTWPGHYQIVSSLDEILDAIGFI